ncbi:hypothetical protein ACFSKU_15645 [Pontibacter silvestris]|uniref:Uncharacterized protein n=1 Tax=Pontibacter silvestris TaxID=2305183 RepID=A0ABW4X2C3_9BACT|nr:hypothetical protein [Pontibacter silvestris]MCC9137558.1 hypothetical protein [Pontibacter silvestris]
MMAPEAAIMALHEHKHTEDKPTSEVVVSVAHLHCDVDDLYNENFVPPYFLFELALVPKTGYYIEPYSYVWKFTFPNNIYLRGPPVA